MMIGISHRAIRKEKENGYEQQQNDSDYRAPYTTMLEDSLEHRQELVGGDIECIPLPCETVLCCNASGKLTGLPENRQYGPDTLHGTFFLYGDTPEGRGVSLTDEQIAMYQEYFPQPVPAAVSFEVRSAADMKEFMNLMFGKGHGHRSRRGYGGRPMSKMFSVVTLDAPHSLMTEHFVPGSPDGLDELLDCDEISEVLAEWPLGDTIEAKIQTYLYGDGETVRADEEDLAFFREHFDELNASDALDCISDHSFSFESDELDFGYGEESEDEEDLEL